MQKSTALPWILLALIFAAAVAAVAWTRSANSAVFGRSKVFCTETWRGRPITGSLAGVLNQSLMQAEAEGYTVASSPSVAVTPTFPGGGVTVIVCVTVSKP